MSDVARDDDELVSDDELLFDRAFSALPDMEPHAPATFRPQMPPLPRYTPPPRVPSHVGRSAASREQSPFRPGDLLAGKYQVERVVGRAGIGIVAYVRHAEVGQPFVLKCLPLEACRVPDAVSRFLRGARAAMRLQSEHTSRTIDAGRLASGAPYVVTEACAGSDLREVLRVRGLLTLTESVDFVLQAAESVAEAHSHGLIHRNLSPYTLFVTRRPDGSPLIKVLDYGVADALRPDPMRVGEIAGEGASMFDANPMVEALGCLSPEQIRGTVELDARTDIWALGAVLHQLLSGSPVYSAQTVPGLLATIAADPPPPITSVRSDVPAGLEAVLLRCLEKDRGARFASLADLAAALRRFAPPEAQGSADRITRTLGRSARAPQSIGASSALVYVGPPASAPPPALPRQASPRAASPRAALVPYPLLWSTLLVAFGLVGGTIAGVLVTTRSGEQAALAQRILAQQAEPLQPLPATAEAPPPSAQAPARARVPRAQPIAAQARPAPAPAAIDTADLAPGRVPPRTSQTAESAAQVKPPHAKQAAVDSPQTAKLGGDLFDSVR